MSPSRRVIGSGLLALGLAVVGSARSMAQAPTIGEVAPPPGSPGGVGSSMGLMPGAGGSDLTNPGAGQILGGRPGASVPRVPTSISTPAGPQSVLTQPSTAVRDLAPTELPIFGTLAILAIADDAGPPDGLTLDDAIERYVRDSLDLRGKYMEIPQAQADVLTASLRANPIFYSDAQLIPYGQYSAARPGGQQQYDVNISYPLDLTHKRQARTKVACRVTKVLEAQYQDEVRLGIANVSRAYVDVLAARGAVRFSKASLDGLMEAFKVSEAFFKKGDRPKTEPNRLLLQVDNAEVALASNEETYRRAKRTLGVLLNIPPYQAQALEFRGTLRDVAPPPPNADELIRIALTVRPDVLSYRLGVARADADVSLARANVLPDVYLLYQPYTFQDNAYQGLKSSTSWAVGVTIPIPVYNRNQGNIKRARLNVTQTKIQLGALETIAVNEVVQAEQAYRVSLANVKRFEEKTLVHADIVLRDSKKLFDNGEVDVTAYLNARRDYNDAIRLYLESLVAHRRSMLDLNTALGQRILP